MKSVLLTLLALGINAAFAHGAFLPTPTCDIEPYQIYKPIKDILYKFPVKIEATQSTTISIYDSEENIAATGKLIIVNYANQEEELGQAIIEFEEYLYLPVGQTFTIFIPRGTMWALNDSTTVNDIINTTFTIPTSFSPASVAIDSHYISDKECRISSAKSINWEFPIEIGATAKSKLTLLRDGVRFGEYVPKADYDWGYGYASVQFDPQLYFDKDVPYAFVLEGGSVSSFRTDIVNAPDTVCFIGDYADASIADVYVEEGPKVLAQGGCINISTVPSGTYITIYASDGRLVRSITSSGQPVNVPVPSRGVYLVAIHNRVTKVMV